jgi:hypothetical protein
MLSRADAVKLAQDVVDARVKSVPEAARWLALFVLADHEEHVRREADKREMFDNLTATQTRCTELLEQVRELLAELHWLAALFSRRPMMSPPTRPTVAPIARPRAARSFLIAPPMTAPQSAPPSDPTVAAVTTP